MRMTIGLKLGMGFLAMLVLTIAMGVAGTVNITKTAQATDTLAREAAEVREVLAIKETVVETEDALERAIVAGTEGQIAIGNFFRDRLDAMVGGYIREAGATEELSAVHAEFSELCREYLNVLSEQGKVTTSKPVNEKVKEYMDVLTELETESNERIAVAIDDAQRVSFSAIRLTIVLGIAATLVGMAVSVGIALSITRAIAQLVRVTDRISMGDLDVAVGVSSQDEIGELAESIERMRISLKTAMERLTGGA